MGFSPTVGTEIDPESYVRANTPLQHSDGIGLWLVRWIVDAYDGDVAIENASDGGAVVTVTLPMADPEPSSSPEPRSPVASGSGSTDNKHQLKYIMFFNV